MGRRRATWAMGAPVRGAFGCWCWIGGEGWRGLGVGWKG